MSIIAYRYEMKNFCKSHFPPGTKTVDLERSNETVERKVTSGNTEYSFNISSPETDIPKQIWNQLSGLWVIEGWNRRTQRSHKALVALAALIKEKKCSS